MTTLSPDFLRALVLVFSFRGEAMQAAQGAFLSILLQHGTATAADLPRELIKDKFGNPSAHISGCVTGALVAQGLIQEVGRVKSPDPVAKGRKLNVWRIVPEKRSTAKAWLRSHGYPVPESAEQLSLIA